MHIFAQIQSDNPDGAAALAVLLLGSGAWRCCWRSARSSAGGRGMIAKYGLRFVALFYLARSCSCPVAMIVYHTLRERPRAGVDAINEPDAVKALELTPQGRADRGAAEHALRDRVRARDRAPAASAARRSWRRCIDLPFAVSPVVVGLTLILVYGQNGWFGQWFIDHGHPVIFAVPGHGARDDLRVAAVRRPRGDPGAARDRHRAGAGGLHARARAAARPSGASRCPRSAGASSTASF